MSRGNFQPRRPPFQQTVNSSAPSSTKTMEKSSIQIKINAKFINALIGTGSRVSILHDSLLSRLKIHPQPLDTRDLKFLYGANGSRFPITGKVLLPVKLHNL